MQDTRFPACAGRSPSALETFALVPSVYGLDDDIDVLLRDKRANSLQSKKVSYETQRQFCFEGQLDGEYQMVFVLHKRGVAQPALVFPASFKKTRDKPCNSIYMVEPICPK